MINKTIPLNNLYFIFKDSNIYNSIEELKNQLGDDFKIEFNFFEKNKIYNISTILEILNIKLDLLTLNELKSVIYILYRIQKFDQSHIDILDMLINYGPLWDGEVQSIKDRTELFDLNLITKVVYKGKNDFNCATNLGGDYFKLLKFIK